MREGILKLIHYQAETFLEFESFFVKLVFYRRRLKGLLFYLKIADKLVAGILAIRLFSSITIKFSAGALKDSGLPLANKITFRSRILRSL